ncbi:MAG: IMP dehydrogenase, partial [Chitinispirillia bacterium]
MANILQSISMSLKDFRILPGYTDKNCEIQNVSLKTKLCIKDNDYLYLNIPFISAAMQAVTGTELAIALSILGGIGVLPVSQSIEEQCKKLKKIKRYKVGFQKDLAALSENQFIKDVINTIDINKR